MSQREISDVELDKVRKVFEHICEDILNIPKDAVTIRQDGDSCGIYCDNDYFEKLSKFMLSLKGWEPIEPQTESEDTE